MDKLSEVELFLSISLYEENEIPAVKIEQAAMKVFIANTIKSCIIEK